MKRRSVPVLTVIAIALIAMSVTLPAGGTETLAQAPPAILDPTSITKYSDPLVIPPAMPRTGKIKVRGGKNIEYYEIAVRQFQQQVLPSGMPMTTVWSYGSAQYPGTVAEGGSFNYPAFTIESKWKKPVRVKWINDLVDANGDYLPHLVPVDQTLHWANPPGGTSGRDTRGDDPTDYAGPVPIITHVHGAHTYEESDGYPEAWYLPAANDIPAGYATTGTYYDTFKPQAEAAYGQTWDPGTAVFQYPNDQRATTLWYHDHTLGMTRVNVYAGPAGFYLLRGGPGDEVLDGAALPATLPGPAPALGDAPGMTYYEIPIVIQDRMFYDDGSLFYPDNRAFFEGLEPDQLQIPFIPDEACDGQPSDVSPIWQPEFFGDTMVVNGKTWPYQDVEQRRYRLRFLNGSNSRFLILQFDNPNVQVWQIGADGGFLAAPVDINAVSSGQLLLGPAERADLIVDFGSVPVGTQVTLLNLGPDEPFGGGIPGVDFDPADPNTTGQVMQFRVMAAPPGPDPATPPDQLVLPAITALVPDSTTPRQISLNEEESASVRVVEDADGNIVLACDDPDAEPFGPTSALLGTVNPDGTGNPLTWMAPITENPAVGATETWEIHNLTVDAHPIHIHLVQFQVVDRQPFGGVARPPEPGETGFKDTVIAYPGEITRVRAKFDLAGLFVWHCHIIEHEDNEMMRPYRVGPTPMP
jgi:FtsP/CotA-like multicopper oxidase with cupredoxin domain